jgi:hypothetical protein
MRCCDYGPRFHPLFNNWRPTSSKRTKRESKTHRLLLPRLLVEEHLSEIHFVETVFSRQLIDGQVSFDIAF